MLFISSFSALVRHPALARHPTPLMRQPVVFTDRPPAPPPPAGVKPQKKRHTLLTFGFTGTGFWGLQSQNADGDADKPTVADLLRAALRDEGFIAPSNWAPLTRTRWVLASRTDKGVHAACAAASVMLETCDDDIDLLDGSALTAQELGDGADDWLLSPSALSRINARLPQTVRVFSGGRVRKKFSARECASARTYEYLVPEAALGPGATVEELDTTLRMFEGTHRMHNFASGLRKIHDDSVRFPAEAPPEESWPLALSPDERASAAYRSVVTCRVHRRVEVGGAPYLVLRIAGIAFVLHQIRHMVGAALAVTNRVVPRDAVAVALNSPLRIDVSPLAPGCGLLLDQIEFFDTRLGVVDAAVPHAARHAMEAFKEEVVYPHVHGLYEAGVYADFLAQLRCGALTQEFEGEQAAVRLRRVDALWQGSLAARSAARAERQRLRHAAAAAAAAAIAPAAEEAEREAPVEDGVEDGLVLDEEAGAAHAGSGKSVLQSLSFKERSKLLPGGLMVELCTAWQKLPGPATHAAMEWLREQVAGGALLTAQPYDYYMAALRREEEKEEERSVEGVPWHFEALTL